MSSSKEINLQRDFSAGVYLSEAPSPSRLVLNHVSYTMLKTPQNMVSNRAQQPPPPPSHTSDTLKYLFSSDIYRHTYARKDIKPEQKKGEQTFYKYVL
jgi:hypothetical protein